jgi:small subunit ribosomal protein S6
MRDYELTVVYDLAVAEAGGADAGPQRITAMVESRGGKMLKVDHWGRRRMAYPIGTAIDADYVVTRVEL